jgi:DNA-binding response OmpR family regulator
MERKLITVLDDDEHILELIKINLSKENFEVKTFEKPKQFFNFIQQNIPDLIILDIMLPEVDGYEVCKKLKTDSRLKNVPIIFLSAKSEEVDKVLGLELGAEDYIVKPFSVRELIARVRVVLRRGKDEKFPKQITIGKILTINFETFDVYVEDKKVELTTTEFKLLEVLVSNKNKVLSRDKLLDYLWGTQKAVIDRTIDVHIAHLREKLGKAARFIKSFRGVGYKFED